jgi:ACS family sodium-dependent inorganic phosphate cotransporter
MRGLLGSPVSADTDTTDASTTLDDDDDDGLEAFEGDRLTMAPLETSDAHTLKDTKNAGRKTMMLFLLWTIAWLSALDRVAMSVALLPISEEYNYTDSVKGSISSLFSVGYGVAILPAGLLVAHASPRTVMAFGLALWSVSTIATPVATRLAVDNMAPLLFVRACVGAGESVIMPTIQKLLQSWMQPDEKSLALATIIFGFQCGSITAYLLSPIVIDVFGGWEILFYLYGGTGLFILIPWFFLAQDSPEDQTEPPATTEPLRVSRRASWDESIVSFRDAPWMEFATSRAVWAMMLTGSSTNWVLYNTLAWSPIFYSEQYGIGIRDSAWMSVLPSVSGTLGGFFAGYSADAAIRKLKPNDDNGIANVRKLFQCISQYGPAVAYGFLTMHLPGSPWGAQAFLMLALTLLPFSAAGNESAVQEKAGKRWVGLLYSVISLPAVMFGTLGVYVTGVVLDMSGQNWSYAFGLNAIVMLLGATAFLTMYDSRREFE